jgi:hypothetical protein
LAATKRDRLDEIIRRLNGLPAFHDAAAARLALEEVMRNVEDELSGIAENPDSATSPPDGRMYPPHDRYEKVSGSPRVRLFKQTGHQTWFGENGAIRIQQSNGVIEIDKPGADHKTVTDLLLENRQ